MKRNHRRYRFPDGRYYPVVESTKSGIVLLATEQDVAHATPKNPTECVLAQCAIRMGAVEAFIAGTCAYIAMPFQGEVCAIKFRIPLPTQRAIKHFDETGEMPAEGFILAPCPNHMTSAAKKIANARRTDEQKKRWSKKPRPGDERRFEFRTWRHLTGHVYTEATK